MSSYAGSISVLIHDSPSHFQSSSLTRANVFILISFNSFSFPPSHKYTFPFKNMVDLSFKYFFILSNFWSISSCVTTYG